MDTENKFSTNMEKEKWIENILNSTNGISKVSPNDELFSKIQQRVQQRDVVSAKALWLVAASIAALILLNISVVNLKSKSTPNAATAYFERTINTSNQLY